MSLLLLGFTILSIWIRITDFVTDTAESVVGRLIEAVRTAFEGDPETRQRVSFSIAMIALSAKLAKADGIVTESEVNAFQEIFDIPSEDAKHVSRLYNLAKQDVAGFETYASQLAKLCGSGQQDCVILRDIIDGLFHIAKADNLIHDSELAYLRRVAEIFNISDREFERILSRHVDMGKTDPYRVLGIERGASHDAARKTYLALVREHHPDVLSARGLPMEFVRIANDRLAAINAAWEMIEQDLPKS